MTIKFINLTSTRLFMKPSEILKIMEKSIKRKAYIDRTRTKDKLLLLILILISARTKDELLEEVSSRIIKSLSSRRLCKLTEEEISRIIYPVGFYKTKAKHIKELCRIIKEKYKGKVPNSIDELVKLPGVGRKTANLFLATAYNKKTICVDVHVHRISNRLGLVNTKTPAETEKALEKIFDKKDWPKINEAFVPFGKEICRPVNPRCDICPLKNICKFNKSKKNEQC